MPYRNGIIHGRELGYANKIVAAKCWAALFAIYDWATLIQDRKKNPPKSEQVISLREIVKRKKKSQLLQEQIKNWKARTITIGIDIPECGTSDEYNPCTPEKATIQFFEYWKINNYGFIAKQIHNPFKDSDNNNETIKRVRRILSDKRLVSYKIVIVEDKAFARCEVTMSIKYEYKEVMIEQDIVLTLICQEEDGRAPLFGAEGGRWYYIGVFLYSIERKSLISLSDK